MIEFSCACLGPWVLTLDKLLIWFRAPALAANNKINKRHKPHTRLRAYEYRDSRISYWGEKMNEIVNTGLLRQIDGLYQMLSHPLQEQASSKGIKIKVTAHYLDFIRESEIVRIALKHLVYAGDIIKYFDYYFTSVVPVRFNGHKLVDYSIPKYHEIHGYDFGPIYFPSFSEPMVTTEQYLDFAKLSPGCVVLDLGAYAGLTSIMFKDIVGPTGTVIAVDADAQNVAAIEKNFRHYKQRTANDIELIHAAVWSHCDGLEFSSEGNMGSSASQIVGGRRGDVVFVKSLTLDAIAAMKSLERLDFIKCDVEGAEAVIFENAEMLHRLKPRIIIEPHFVGGVLTIQKCAQDLAKYGYVCKPLTQIGIDIPLLEAHPPIG